MKTCWSRSSVMKGSRLFASGIIFIALLLSVGLTTAQAKPPHMLTGSTYFYVPDWGGVKIWTTFEVKEIDPATGTAKGNIWATVYDPWIDGWKSLVFAPECVKFEDNTVTMVLEVTQKTGVGNGEVGEHAKWQIYDGGNSGPAKDTWTIKNYQLDPWIEYWPVDVPAPDCPSFDADPVWEAGALRYAGKPDCPLAYACRVDRICLAGNGLASILFLQDDIARARSDEK